MDFDQPDLFGGYDARQEQRRLANLPHTCPWCGTTEPNRYVMGINHAPDSLLSAARQQCLAQWNCQNHIISAIRSEDADWLGDLLDWGDRLELDVEAIIGRERQTHAAHSSQEETHDL